MAEQVKAPVVDTWEPVFNDPVPWRESENQLLKAVPSPYMHSTAPAHPWSQIYDNEK